MASTIAAVTTSGGGVVTTADASGNLNLLAGTTTVVALTTAGAAVSGTLSNTTGATFATSSGNVLVGTTSNVPGSRLVSVGNAVQLSGGTTAQAGVRVQVASGVATFTGINNDNNAYNPLAFYTSGTEAMRIDSSGNVGIGTASPSAKLQVDSSSATYSANIRARNSNFGSGVVGAINSILTVATDMNNMAFYTASNLGVDGASAPTNERMRINSSGNILIGTTTGNADARLTPSGGSTDSSPCIDFSKGSATTTTAQVYARFFCNNNTVATGSITANGVSAATFTGYSDIRLKENIVDLPSQLSNIMALRPVEFDFKGYENGEGHQLGFIAQEVQEIYPDLIGEGTDGMLTLSDMNKNDARLIKCIQEQQALIIALTDRIAALEAK